MLVPVSRSVVFGTICQVFERSIICIVLAYCKYLSNSSSIIIIYELGSVDNSVRQASRGISKEAGRRGHPQVSNHLRGYKYIYMC